MGKAFRRALDRRGQMRRNVSHRTMMSNIIAVQLELHAFLARQEALTLSEELIAEMKTFEEAASAYLRGVL